MVHTENITRCALEGKKVGFVRKHSGAGFHACLVYTQQNTGILLKKEDCVCGYAVFSFAGSEVEHTQSDLVTRRRVELLFAA